MKLHARVTALTLAVGLSATAGAATEFRSTGWSGLPSGTIQDLGDFKWTAITEPAAIIPAPAAISFVALGVLLLLRRRRCD